MKLDKKIWLVGLTVLLTVPAMAQEADNDEKKGGWLSYVDKVIGRFHSNKVDTNYIMIPKEPWQVSVKSRVAQTDLQMYSTIDGGAVYGPILEGTGLEIVGPLQIRPKVMTPVSSSVGVKVGYRGVSASYTMPVGGKGDKGRSLSLRSLGKFYSVHVRYRQFEDKSPEVPGTIHMKGLPAEAASMMKFIPGPIDADTGAQEYGIDGRWDLKSPIKIKTLMFDGFYIFNYKRFSYGAAYNQKTIQKRSAGSFIAGVMAYYADLRFDQSSNGELITYMGGIGRIRQWQGSVGGGYAYNYVPAKGWLIGATAMPMVTFVNKMRMDRYSSDFVEKTTQEMSEQSIVDFYNSADGEYSLKHEGCVTHNNKMTVNFTARLSVTYNWSRYFVNVNGQFNNFHYSHKSSMNNMHGYLNDWYINSSVGIRL